MKKFVSLLLAFLIVLSFAACGNSEKNNALIQTIRGMNWTGKSHTEKKDKTYVKENLLTRDDKYTVVFNQDDTCTVTVDSTLKYGEHYPSNTLKGRTESSSQQWDCKWSVKSSGKKATVTLTSDESFGSTPYVYTLELDENGNIKNISGTNKVNDPILFLIDGVYATEAP